MALIESPNYWPFAILVPILIPIIYFGGLILRMGWKRTSRYLAKPVPNPNHPEYANNQTVAVTLAGFTLAIIAIALSIPTTSLKTEIALQLLSIALVFQLISTYLYDLRMRRVWIRLAEKLSLSGTIASILPLIYLVNSANSAAILLLGVIVFIGILVYTTYVDTKIIEGDNNGKTNKHGRKSTSILPNTRNLLPRK